jgi:metal-responsive CopG/Arc/MetJ family transcriptional regulator
MEKAKFEITPKKYSSDTTVVSLRLPKDMLDEINKITKQTRRTRNEIMTIMLEYAIENTEIIE